MLTAAIARFWPISASGEDMSGRQPSKVQDQLLPRSSGHLVNGAIMRCEVSDDKEEAI